MGGTHFSCNVLDKEICDEFCNYTANIIIYIFIILQGNLASHWPWCLILEVVCIQCRLLVSAVLLGFHFEYISLLMSKEPSWIVTS